MRKKVCSLLLCAGMMLSLAFPAGSAEKSRIESVKVGSMEHFGYPIQAAQTNSSVCSVMDGNNIFGAMIEGKPSVFYVYDLDNNKLIGQYPVDGVSDGAHGFGKAPNGDRYVTTQSTAKLCRYSVSAKEFTVIGDLPGQSASYGVTFDEEGNAYVGTYPDAKIFKYDPVKKELTDMGTPFPGQNYVRALSYHGGYIYCGGYHNETKFARMNVKTGAFEMLENPNFEGVVNKDKIKLYWFMDTVHDDEAGDFLTALVTPLDGSSFTGVYDLSKQKWIDTINVCYGYRTPSTTDNGVIYTVKNFPVSAGEEASFSSGNNRIAGYNLRTGEEFDTGIPYLEPGSGDGLRGASLLRLKDQQTYPGLSIVTTNFEFGVPAIINLQNKTVTVLKEELRSQNLITRPVKLRSIGYAGENLIGYGGYKARSGGVFNTDTNTNIDFPIEQVEDVEGIDGKVYYGQYAGAKLFEFDPSKPPAKGENPKQVARLNNEQDRIFDMTKAGDKIALSSYPITTSHTGALSFYDPETGDLEVVRPMDGHSITCSVYKDGLLYVGTNVWGGLGTKPVVEHAKIFIYDMVNKKIIREAQPKIEGYDKPILNYGDLIFGDDGLLWGNTIGGIYALDPQTLEVKKSKVLDDKRWPDLMSSTGIVLFPQDLYRLKNGLLVSKSSSNVHLVDPETLESKQILSNAYRLTVGGDGNIYYTTLYDLRKIPLYFEGETVSSDQGVTEKLAKTIVLQLDNSKALVNGTSVPIDTNDGSVTARTINDRTVVPVRFVGESVGASVDWDDASQTVTVRAGSTVIETVLGEQKIIVNGEEKAIDVPAQTVNDRTLLPLRAFVEALGKTVYWDERGFILIGDGIAYDGQKDRELIDRIRYQIAPELLEDLQKGGSTSPFIEECKKTVKFEAVKLIEQAGTSSWELVPFSNLDLKKPIQQIDDTSYEGAAGAYYKIPGMVFGKDAEMLSFRLMNAGSIKNSNYSKNPQTVEIIDDSGTKALKINSPVPGNAINMYMPTLYFNETYTKDCDYKMTFLAKRAASAEGQSSAFTARIRYGNDSSANLGQTTAVEIPVTDEFMPFTIKVEGNKIPSGATYFTGLFYVTSQNVCNDVILKDIKIEVNFNKDK